MSTCHAQENSSARQGSLYLRVSKEQRCAAARTDLDVVPFCTFRCFTWFNTQKKKKKQQNLNTSVNICDTKRLQHFSLQDNKGQTRGGDGDVQAQGDAIPGWFESHCLEKHTKSNKFSANSAHANTAKATETLPYPVHQSNPRNSSLRLTKRRMKYSKKKRISRNEIKQLSAEHTCTRGADGKDTQMPENLHKDAKCGAAPTEYE